jgi:cystathionine beta-lyase
MNKENPAKFFEKEAGIYLSDGSFFGKSGHVRFNFGCPHSRVIEGLEKMAKVID